MQQNLPRAQCALASFSAEGPCTSGCGGNHRDLSLPAKMASKRPLDACGCHSAHSSMIKHCTASLRLSVQFLRSNKNNPRTRCWTLSLLILQGLAPLSPLLPHSYCPFLRAVQSCDLSLTASRVWGPAASLTARSDPSSFFRPGHALESEGQFPPLGLLPRSSC